MIQKAKQSICKPCALIGYVQPDEGEAVQRFPCIVEGYFIWV